jgi:hypothetical protein
MMLAGDAPARNAKGLASSRKLGRRFPPRQRYHLALLPRGHLGRSSRGNRTLNAATLNNTVSMPGSFTLN